ncbi:MAG: pantoate--beta-alanine ligase [Bacteroidetes bacterium]|nr:MAG: pantoate--beta-alanine ligase [Bacteroidota bacterium]
MFIFKDVEQISQHIHKTKASAQRIGFIPTMGALHAGHLSLIKASKQKHCYSICSIYVNPTQFNNASDLDNYPVTIEKDAKMLSEAGCDVLFLPTSDQMYGGKLIATKFDYGNITRVFEGAKRPGHFDGVITIVSKLIDVVMPDEVFFGQKDLQQCMVVKKLLDTSYPNVLFNMQPTQRENSGLAMSSRNVRLSKEEAVVALRLYQALNEVKLLLNQGLSVVNALAEAKLRYLQHPLLKLEYLDVVDSATMETVEFIASEKQYAVIIACWCAEVRLIDNILLTES